MIDNSNCCWQLLMIADDHLLSSIIDFCRSAHWWLSTIVAMVGDSPRSSVTLRVADDRLVIVVKFITKLFRAEMVKKEVYFSASIVLFKRSNGLQSGPTLPIANNFGCRCIAKRAGIMFSITDLYSPHLELCPVKKDCVINLVLINYAHLVVHCWRS